ncbi:PTS beta-glucoside transporter subunit EIIBCA [Bombilactobacillus bombi]|uniref:PTS system sucrose-specific EIIBCA component n=1 Tax=Bombilactobacillus bombi TaxID=1303590 RepID=A0A3R6VAC3_9LACO|nr:beta-glucoside-specific PTS transporter subunit IIABC [Bombilactobacillus bombi]RHW51201.1 PTS beta-glucoside transporter subunit EIIBCA [Bombilactobacillus bombi]
MAYEELSKNIIKNVGGKDNVASVVHCTTRLRFKLKDEKKADDSAMKATDGVISVVKSGGQYQVVIGNNVADVYDTLIKVGGFSDGGSVPDDYVDKSNMSILDKFIDLVSSIFSPILGPLSAAGMIKGFNAMFVAFGWLKATDGTYIILNAIGDGLFYFLPVILGISAAKKFKVDIILGSAIGAALVYPTIVSLNSSKNVLFTLFKGTFFQSQIHTTFLKIPVIMMNYTSSVIPIIAAMWFASKVQKVARRVIPDVVKTFLVPFVVLLITVPITFLVIGPLSTWLGSLISAICVGIYNLSPILAGLVLGGFWQVLVMFGLHWALVAIGMSNIATQGFDIILPLMIGTTFAQTGVVIAMFLQTKNEKTKGLTIPAIISGIFGVTEPAIYGLTLPRKKPFILSCIGGAVGGGIVGLFKSKIWMMGGMGIFNIPAFIGKNGLDMPFYGMLIAIVVSLILGFLLQIIFGKKSVDEPLDAEAVETAGATSTQADSMSHNNATVVEPEINYNQSTKLASPLTGTIVPLADIKDEVFSSGAMGQGVAIEPSVGEVVAPADATVQMVFPTGHAVGLTTDDGAEILIHIGMDTVQLDGKGFETLVKKGDHVTAGQLLVKFDIDTIKDAKLEVTTPIIITNTKNYHEVKTVATGKINQKDELLELK